MVRSKLTLAALLMLGSLLCWSLSQAQPGKEAKDPPVKQPAEPDTLKDDLVIINANGMKGTGPDLLDYFHNKTLKQPVPKQIAALIKQLGDDDFGIREKAFTDLIGMGGSTITNLKESENDPDLEVRKRVADLKARIDAKAEPQLQAAAARVVARLKPAGAADKLIAFLPFANESYVVEAICKALAVVAVRDGKVEPILVKSLSDEAPIRRAAAGEALARAGAKEEFANVKKLMKDPEVSVRLRVTMAMVTSQDREVVPALIELLGDLPPEQAWRPEEALYLLADGKGPKVRLGTDAASRKDCRDAWAKWYADNEKGLDMTKLAAGSLFRDYTMIAQYNNRIGGPDPGNVGEVFELDENKKIRWKVILEQNVYPVDAQVIHGGQRVLIAEYQKNRITERDVLKGEVKWEHPCGGAPIQVQRLPNGHTFIATQARLMEIDRDKRELWAIQRPNPDIVRARMLPSGEVAFITNSGSYIRQDGRTQQVKQQAQVSAIGIVYGSMEILPNGNILVPLYSQHRVVEYTPTGNQVGNPLTINYPSSVVRLPSGNNLVASYQTRKIVEFNGNQQVWDYSTDGLLFVARRR
jgi:hypothetical protein